MAKQLSVKKKRKCYSDNAMTRAILMARGGTPQKTAANLCGVPYATLWDKLHGKVPEDPTRPGTRPILTK